MNELMNNSTLTTIHDFDTLLQFATEIVASGTRQERSNVLNRFNPREQCVVHPQSVVLRNIARAIKINGSWEACPPWLKQSIEAEYFITGTDS